MADTFQFLDHGFHWPMLPQGFRNEELTEDRIERMVESLIDRADAILMSGACSQKDYDLRIRSIDCWSGTLYARRREYRRTFIAA
jgi:hypothetical protein